MSLRVRLLIATAAVSLLALALVDIVTYTVVTRSELRQIDDSLNSAHRPIEQRARDGGRAALDSIPTIAPDTYVAILDSHRNTTFEVPVNRFGDEFDLDLNSLASTLQLDDRAGGPRAMTVTSVQGDHARLRIDPLSDGGWLITAESLHEIDETRQTLLAVLVSATAASVLIVIGVGWWLVRSGLRPLTRVGLEASQITDDDLAARRVSGARPDTEIGRVATALNLMLDRLQTSRDERQQTLLDLQASEARTRRFVADASHELRTPVAATAAYAELFERGARDRPADLERAMTGIRNETARMATLVDDLLRLTRLDETIGSSVETVDLTEVVLESIDAARTIAPERTVRPEIHGQVRLRGNRAQLRQVVDNLLANVRTHTPPDTTCLVALSQALGMVTLVVSDNGPGVPDEQLGKLFDRFFRVDPARSRIAGGSGLGLSIVHAIVSAHGGVIRAERQQPRGLRITIEIPTGIES
jgi:two-component system, OmpR family, sensor kinase